MKEVLTMLWHQVVMPGYTMKQRLTVWYFCISFSLVCCIGDETSLPVAIVLVINFCNAARIINTYLPDDDL